MGLPGASRVREISKTVLQRCSSLVPGESPGLVRDTEKFARNANFFRPVSQQSRGSASHDRIHLKSELDSVCSGVVCERASGICVCARPTYRRLKTVPVWAQYVCVFSAASFRLKRDSTS